MIDNAANALTEQSTQKLNPEFNDLTVDYFYVAVDQQCDGYRVRGYPVSPYFRTGKEAKAFQASCEIEGVYCLRCGFYPTDAEDAKQIKEMLFGSETQAAMTDPICYQAVKNEQA